MYKIITTIFVWILVHLPVILPAIAGSLSSIQELAEVFRPSELLSTLRGNNIYDNLTVRYAKSNLSTPTLKQVMYYNHFAAAVYCNDPTLSTWSCDDCFATGQDTKLLKVFKYPRSYTQAFIAINIEAKEIIITFRGVITLLNMWEDSTIEQIHVPGGDGNIMVHKGGWLHWLWLKDQVIGELRNTLGKSSQFRLIIIGHSFGSIVASLALFDLKHTPEFASLPYSLYSYGGQRAGNIDFALWFRSQNIPAIRVVNGAELYVHTYPSSLGYVHHLRELWINGDTNIVCSEDVLEDPNCSNSLGPNYNNFDHFKYWNVYYPPNDCVMRSPLSYLFPSLRRFGLNLLLRSRTTKV